MSDLQQDQILLFIARHCLRVPTLSTRHSDALDFREVSVWNLKAALEAAFDAGRQQAEKGEREAGQDAALAMDALGPRGVFPCVAQPVGLPGAPDERLWAAV